MSDVAADVAAVAAWLLTQQVFRLQLRLPTVGQAAGSVALASTVSNLCFPLVVAASARLAPAFGRWASQLVPDDEDDDE